MIGLGEEVKSVSKARVRHAWDRVIALSIHRYVFALHLPSLPPSHHVSLKVFSFAAVPAGGCTSSIHTCMQMPCKCVATTFFHMWSTRLSLFIHLLCWFCCQTNCGTTYLAPRVLASGLHLGGGWAACWPEVAALAGVMAPMDRESETWSCTRWAGTRCKGTARENHDVGL